MKKKGNFDQFRKKSNAAVKEQFKQEKRKWKKEREEFFDEKKKAIRAQKTEKDESLKGNNQVGEKKSTITRPVSKSPEQMPLNKFLAHAGISSRRDAADIVKEGRVTVNGEVIKEPGHKVSEKDDIRLSGKKLVRAQELIYILLNKPKDYLTTTEDPHNRKTILELVKNATRERIYPVGRLDRNTSGVLLITNDGELAQKLTHPRNEITKVYAVTLDRPLDKKDFQKIVDGVTLDDGLATVDNLAYTDAQDKTQVGLEIHSGKNRIVRRIFEKLGYDVKNLDRVVFAGLTKKNVPRGKWRFLNQKEVRELKFFGKGKR